VSLESNVRGPDGKKRLTGNSLFFKPPFSSTFNFMRLCFLLLLAALIGRSLKADTPSSPPIDWKKATIDDLAHAAAAIPVAAFFDHPEVSRPRLSPDGQKIAFLFPHEGRRALGLYDCKTGEARMILRATNESLDTCAWKGNEHILTYADFHGGGYGDMILTDLSGKNVVKLNEKRGVWGIIEARPFDPERILAQLKDGIYLLNVFNGNYKEVMSLPSGGDEEKYDALVPDSDGQIRFVNRYDNREVSLLHRRSSDQPFRKVISWPFVGYINLVEDISFGSDRETAYIIARHEHDRGALYTFNTRTLAWSDPIFVPPQGEIVGLSFSADGGRLEGVSYEDSQRHDYWLDPAVAALHASVEKTFPGYKVTFVSASLDNHVLLLRIWSDREPGKYFLLDRSTGKIQLFKRDLLRVDARLMRPMEPFTVVARDGLKLEGYLTRPWASAHGAVPLVVLPHGGPYGIRNSWGFDHEVQFLASRGYAVVQVNYRGSGGYGKEFLFKGKYQWGRAMQDDLTDTVNWLVRQGIADPKRVAIFGASYGGYAALAGVTLTPELYCCAINYVGGTDLEITFHRLGSDAYHGPAAFDFRNEWVGPTKNYRAETSPILHIDRIRVPTLHAYGANDPIIEAPHWERLRKELTAAKKDFEFLIEKEEGHGFDQGRGSIEFFEKVDQFLAKNLAPQR
jgi:dienelactone hydrolase